MSLTTTVFLSRIRSLLFIVQSHRRGMIYNEIKSDIMLIEGKLFNV